ncbi:MAG: TadE/TadG family type IV pilus assembly protein, partial [bacterium]|nr:TadE/TadG family type IV pilus assembly protein [bacterium]
QSLVETVLIFPLLLLLIMGIIQMALMCNAKAVVNYAAFCAARAGAVEGDRDENIDRAAQIACSPISESMFNAGNNPLLQILARFPISMMKTEIVEQNIQHDSRFVQIRHHFGLIVPFAGQRFAYQPVITNLPVEVLQQLGAMDVFGLYNMDIPSALPVNWTSFAFEQILGNPQIPVEGRAIVMIDSN